MAEDQHVDTKDREKVPPFFTSVGEEPVREPLIVEASPRREQRGQNTERGWRRYTPYS